MEGENKNDFYDIAVVVITVVVIIALAFFLYYFSSKNSSLVKTETASVSGTLSNFSEKNNATNVIFFKPSEILPANIKIGHCFIGSVAEPFRQDAFRCMVQNEIYDPCFKTLKDGFVFCQTNPLVPEAFLIKLTKSLPLIQEVQNEQNNWAWFLKLKDGAYCSPFTGTRPIFEEKQIAYYGCNPSDNLPAGEKQVVLMGDLITGNVWTANKAILEKDGQNWKIKSLEKVEIDTVWR
jgi:hypothetical protein